MSILLRIFSSPSSSHSNAHSSFLMDNLFAIAFGLGLRFVVDSIAHHDFKLTGTLVGLWEGVVTLHFLKKMPKSFDPYIAYAVRLFVDFMVTESLIRLVLVVVWTGMGMVLADIAPAIWYDVGGHRIWRRFRRDVSYMSRSVPTIPPLFPRARVVRFSPVIEPAEISETLSTFSPTAATPTITSQPPTTRVIPPTPTPPRIIKRPIPGRFPASVVSETDTEATSVAGFRPPVSPLSAGTSHVRYTVRPRRESIDSAIRSPPSSVDGSNVSSEHSSQSTETPSLANQVEEEEIQIPVHSLDKGKGKERAVDRIDPDVPIQRAIVLPPTPSDSYRPHFAADRSSVPTITGMPSIPDFFESGLGSDWEKIHKEEAGLPPSPPEKDFDSRSFESPPVHYIPPPSVYVPTPRPENFDQDLWDEVSNAAPRTPQITTPKQRNSRLPQTTSMIRLTGEAVIPKTVKKKPQPAQPPPAPQTPVYGNTWDTEQDQLPPQTPSAYARTPMYDHTVDLDNEPSVVPGESSTVPPPDQGQATPGTAGVVLEQHNPVDLSFSTDDPWVNPDLLLQEQEEQQQTELKPGESPAPRSKPPTAPPTPRLPAQTPQHRPGTVPNTPQQPPKPVPPQPEPAPRTTVRPAKTAPSTPQQKSVTVPPTPQQKSRTVPSTPQQKPQPVPPVQEKLQTAPVPPTPQHQGGKSVPPTPQSKPQTMPSTPHHPLQPVPPEPIPPTPVQQTMDMPSTSQQPEQVESLASEQPIDAVPPTSQVKPETTLSTSQKRTKSVLQTPVPKQTQDLFDDHTPTKSVPPTPQLKSRTTPSTPQQQPKSVSWATVPKQGREPFADLFESSDKRDQPSLFDDITAEVERLNRSPDLNLQLTGAGGEGSAQQENQREGTLVDVEGNNEGTKEGGDTSPPQGDDGENNENRDNGEGEGQPTEELQLDPDNNPLSPLSSGFSSVAGVPSEIKERNTQAIITRAQIYEMTKKIKELKAEKLIAQGKEEMDPLNEESTLKEQEIQKAEKALEKLKKRAEKRYQAAVKSTGLSTVEETVTLDYSMASAATAATKLEDALGLLFLPDRKGFKLDILLPKGGSGKAVKIAVQKVINEYGFKTLSKVSGVGVTATGKTYTSAITAFRAQYSKEDDS